MNVKTVAVITLILTLVCSLSSCKNISSDLSSIEETIIVDGTDVSSENNSSVEDTTSVEERPVVSEPTEEPVTSKEETPAHPQTTPSVPSQTTKPDSKPNQNTATPSEPATSQTTPKVVQRANTETGISWDGKSPIIYTYADGTTGTKKQEGAKYEAYPGMITTVVTVEKGQELTPSKKPLACTECGKELGDGTNGTCLSYWTGGDHECSNCGEIIPENTCHTCEE